MHKFKTLFGTLFLLLCMASSGASAHTVDFVNVLPRLFGDPIDLENVDGRYLIRAHHNYYIHYDSDDLSTVVPENTLSNLTVVWKKKQDNEFKTISTWVLTDDLGEIIEQEFWLTLICHRLYELTITSTWIGDDDLIPNPLPPSVIAFMSAMAGIGLLLRRRRAKIKFSN